MKIQQSSIQINTRRLEETPSFYQEVLGASLVFDCGWYVTFRLPFPGMETDISFKTCSEGDVAFEGGLTLNLKVDQVDAVHEQLMSRVRITTPLEDHPWGDRGFGFGDPNGLTLYFYHDIKPAKAFEDAYIKA